MLLACLLGGGWQRSARVAQPPGQVVDLSKGWVDVTEGMVLLVENAYFRDGVDLNDQQALTSLAVGAGLPADRVAATLASDDYSADVDQSMATAQRLNISGVPFFIFNQRFAVSGAQPTEIMLKALDAASGAIDIQS
jgi:predicted DsbA family dithiol-disulfide isomerase